MVAWLGTDPTKGDKVSMYFSSSKRKRTNEMALESNTIDRNTLVDEVCHGRECKVEFGPRVFLRLGQAENSRAPRKELTRLYSFSHSGTSASAALAALYIISV